MTLPREDDPRPPYIQAADVLRREIAEGRLKEGDQLPSARALQEKYGIASSTVQNALRVLKSEDLVYTVQGRGSFVRQNAKQTATQRTARFTVDYTPPAWYTRPEEGTSGPQHAAAPARPGRESETVTETLHRLLDRVHDMNARLEEFQERMAMMDLRIAQLEQRRVN